MTIGNREIKTVAVDFDGTLFTDDRFPEVGDPIPTIIDYVKYLKENQGCELILWTNREGQLLEDALAKCAEYGLEFDAVNANMQWRIDKYGSDCRKVGADLYIDDKSLNPIDILYEMMMVKLDKIRSPSLRSIDLDEGN